jgi:cyclophilin family peptidyl-prolyl cis-trans isomerase
MNKYTSFIVVVVLIIFGVWLIRGSSKSEAPINTTGDNLTSKVDEAVKVPSEEDKIITNLDEKKVMQATLHTTEGDITIEFFDKQAPNTVENFIELSKKGFYDGTKFHRVIKDFMIQGGDPNSKNDSKVDLWGYGGPGYKFADEIGPNNRNDVGTISMANSGPNTNGSQFFINVNANNGLDTKHTVFGKVVSGMDVVTKIENTPTGPKDRPLTPIVIKSITLK